MGHLETNLASLPAPRTTLADAACAAIVEHVDAVAARLHLRSRSDIRSRSLAPSDPILKRLDALVRLAEDERFLATCDWIIREDGPERLVWLRERAAALGYDALALRLSPVA